LKFLYICLQHNVQQNMYMAGPSETLEQTYNTTSIQSLNE